MRTTPKATLKFWCGVAEPEWAPQAPIDAPDSRMKIANRKPNRTKQPKPTIPNHHDSRMLATNLLLQPSSIF